VFSRDAVISQNVFQDIDQVDFNTASAHAQWGSVDTYIIDNVFVDVRVGGYLENGPEGTVIAYNYTDGAEECERGHMIHGMYSRETLLEGNDTDCVIAAGDDWWGRNGPRNMVYRNRQRTPEVGRVAVTSGYGPQIGTDRPRFVSDYLSLVANTGTWFYSAPGAPPGDSAAYNMDYETAAPALDVTTNLWLERNIASERITLYPAATTRCGTDSPSDCARVGSLPNSTRGDNAEGTTSTPAGWQSLVIPDSLFLTEAPSWWCEEACPFAAQTGIGALGDQSCKLPAQIRYEAGQCTALAAEAPATHSMGGGSMSGGSWGGP
jgi:hypothetical protein